MCKEAEIREADILPQVQGVQAGQAKPLKELRALSERRRGHYNIVRLHLWLSYEPAPEA